MDGRTFGRALLCASIIGLGAAAVPGAASAAPGFDCYNLGTAQEPNQHEVGEPEGDAYCMGVGSADVTITESSPDVTVSGNGSGYAYVTYTGASTGPAQYAFSATDGTDTENYTAYVDNRAATNDPPTCLGQQSGSGDALPIGTETFAAGCFDDEGETGNVTISTVAAPTRGTFRLDSSDPTRPLLQYTATCSGTDTYSLKASDGVNESPVYTGSSANAAGVACSTPPPAPPAKPAVPLPALTFGLKKVPATIQIAANGTAVIPVTGTPGSRGSVGVSSDKAIATAKRKKKAILKFASKRFTVPASGVAKVKVKVTGKALKALKKARKIRVKVTIKTDKTTVTKRIVFKAPKAKAKKRR